MSTKTETVPFQAETTELLHLVIHSLYTHPEIFLRELISNASDALDKLRVESLTEGGAELADAADLRIRLSADKDARTLEVSDNGIGMSREEVAENIGTIARSGTKGFLESLKAARENQAGLPELIGQFGVGFYSSFMVADEVVLETRRAGESGGTRWSSRGEGEYTLEDIEKADCGTTVRLHLKPVSEGAAEGDESARKDFTDEFVLRDVVKRYSDFIEYKIEMEVEHEGEAKLEVLNTQKPLWTRPRNEIEPTEYAEFYKHLTHDWAEPIETVHFRAEGASEYTALLYVPSQRPMGLFEAGERTSRVHLYVKRVFIMADCEELLPVWLRFVRGVVDSSDLPLNVSRETLQHNRQMAQIQKRLTRKVLDVLGTLLANKRETYLEFWKAFGAVLKEGIYYDESHREDVLGLCLFESSKGDETTTLAEYVERMPVKQTEIYVLLAPNRQAAERSPHLEALAAKGYEVLFLVDPVDEFLLERMPQFQGKTLRQVDKGEVDLSEDEDADERDSKEKEHEPLLEAVRKELSETVEDVRFTSRLTDSPACLVAGESEMSPQMRRILREQGHQVPEPKRVLELNLEHPLIVRLSELQSTDAEFGRFSELSELLHGQALLAEGSPVADPTRFSKLLTELLLKG